MDPLARGLVLAGIALVALGVLLQLGPSLPLLGKLPGDLRIERPGLRVYVPIASSIAVSAALSVLLWLLARGR